MKRQGDAPCLYKLLHQQHLARALDSGRQTALIMGRHPGIFAGKNTPLVSHVLAEQIGILEIQRVGGEINFRFRARSAIFCSALAAFIFIFMSFAGHNLYYLISR